MNAGWKCPQLLSKIDSTSDFYFDSISQIKMKNWSKGRITLVGDACYCPSLLSGKGSTLAMAGAYILAGELKQANGAYKRAFGQYENILPQSYFGIWLRNKVFRLMSVSFFSKILLNQFKDKGLKFKEY